MKSSPLGELLGDASIRKKPGPLITVSRQYGCPGTTLAESISEALKPYLTLPAGVGSWQVLNKEIILEAAARLSTPSELVEKISEHERPGVFAEVFHSLSDTYVPGDLVVKRTVADIVRRIGYLGKFIIVGRGGAVLNRDLPLSVHVRLYAPLDWRAERVRENNGVDEAGALQMIKIADREREYIKDFYAGQTLEPEHFDLLLNAATLSIAEMTALVIRVLEMRRIIE